MSTFKLSKLFSSQYVSMSDEELITLIQTDNHEAFNELYLRYKIPLYSYLSGLLSPTLAEEIFQEIFLKLLTKKSTFRFESKVKTWLWTIARNTLFDYWRSLDHKMKKSFDSLETNSGEEYLEHPQDDFETIFLKKVSLIKLKSCVEELPHDHKEIVFLHIQSELSNQEIANLSKISVSAVKSILFRTKVKLTECFKRGGHL